MKMTNDRIKRAVKALLKEATKKEKELSNIKAEKRNIEAQILDIGSELFKVRSQCKHKWDREHAPTVMGRGTCIHCKASDY